MLVRRAAICVAAALLISAAPVARAQQCSCPAIGTTIYAIDPGSGLQRFGFESSMATTIELPGDTPSVGPNGLAVASATDAYWVNGFGLDLITRFNPETGEIIPGMFPVPSPGTPFFTHGNRCRSEQRGNGHQMRQPR